MHTVYVIRNESSRKYYIGTSNDDKRRIAEHNRGQTRSTRRKGKWVLVYKEVLPSKIEAIRRERKIKSYKGGNAFKKLLNSRW